MTIIDVRLPNEQPPFNEKNVIQVPLEDIEKYSNYYLDGPRAIAEQRFKNAKKLNFIPESAKQPAMVSVPEWDSYSVDERQKEIKRMQIYAAMVDNMDANIGRVIDNLKAKGELDNTYIFFFHITIKNMINIIFESVFVDIVEIT